MRTRLPMITAAAAALSVVSLGPAAAQSLDGDVLLVAPSGDDMCALFDELGEDAMAALEELGGQTEQLAGFEPEPVDGAEFGDLEAGLQSIQDAHDDAWSITAATDGTNLVVTVIPDLSDCDAIDDADLDPGVEPGTYLIQPTVDEFCGLMEDVLGQLEDGMNEGDLDEDAAPEGDGDLGALQAFEPEQVDDTGPYDQAASALAAMIDGDDEVDEAAAAQVDDTLTVALTPSMERCLEDMDDGEIDPVADDAPEEIQAPTDVPAGTSPSGPSVPVGLQLAMLLGAALLVGGSVAAAANRRR